MWWSATLDAVCTATNNARCLIARGTRRRLPMPLNDSPLDATLLVVTPENIAFEYRLAGPFRRLPALVLDFCIPAAVVIAMLYLLGYAIFLSAGLAIFIFAILFFIIQWFYCVLFETFFNGQTP